MLAVELVKDRRTKEPASEIAAEIFERTRDNGLIVSKSGADQNTLRIVPPLCLSIKDAEPIAAALEESFRGY